MKAEWKPMSKMPSGKTNSLVYNKETGDYHVVVLDREGLQWRDYLSETNNYVWTELPDPPEKPMVCKHCGEKIYKSDIDLTWYHDKTNDQQCNLQAEPKEGEE